MQKKKEKISCFVQFHLVYLARDFLVRAFHVAAEAVNAIMATATETSAALLNSGTFGVEVYPVEVEVPVLDVGVEVGVEVEVEVPPDGSDIAAKLRMKPSWEP
jgi:hypothetical protein